MIQFLIPNTVSVSAICFEPDRWLRLPIIGWRFQLDPDDSTAWAEPLAAAEGDAFSDDNVVYCFEQCVGEQRSYHFPMDRWFDEFNDAVQYGMKKAAEAERAEEARREARRLKAAIQVGKE